MGCRVEIHEYLTVINKTINLYYRGHEISEWMTEHGYKTMEDRHRPYDPDVYFITDEKHTAIFLLRFV